jgi:AraC-like DNA-binding protein
MTSATLNHACAGWHSDQPDRPRQARIHEEEGPSPPTRSGQFRFSSAALPACERLAAWRSIFGRTIVEVDLEPLSRDELKSDAIVCRLPGLGVLSGFGDAMHLGHARGLIRDDDLSFMTSQAHQWSAAQLGRKPALGPGDGVLMSNADVWSITLASAARFTAFCVPRAALSALLPDSDAALARIVPADSVSLRLLVSYLAVVLDAEALATPELQRLAITHVCDLLGVALGATRDAAELANGRGVRAARLRAIKADILAHVASPHLSQGAVAARLGISPVYIRKLLESEDTSFTQFVLEQRLMRAHRMLSDPRFAHHSIAAIALDAGFGDLSYFNRTFRRRYGTAPSDVRAATRT